jgi:hypothetical protein
MPTREQIYSMAMYLVDYYGADAIVVARQKAARQVALDNDAGILVWSRISEALERLLAGLPPPTIH